MDVKKEIEKEKKRLNEIFEEVDENKKNFCKRQIDSLAFYNVMVAKFEEEIVEVGISNETQNGSVVSPAVSTQLKYQSQINAICRELLKLVPKSERKSKLEELLNG